MKTMMISAVALALAMTPALAQTGHRLKGGEGAGASAAAPKIDERAYKAALDRIPDSKEKYDPWGGVVTPNREKPKKNP